ncbi:MAG: MotA/TolQ/ExbB proton channel family protein [Pseudomonadota bacterium]
MGGLGLADLGSAGPVLALLAILSLISVAVIVARAMALAGVAGGADGRDSALAALEAGQIDAAGSALGDAAPADRVARRAVELVGLGAAPAAVEADLTGLGNAEVAAMGRGLRLLDLVGMVAPLLGLLGTVLGMIQSFRSLELAAGSANASILAGGIWQALLTTAAGLLVAIPALAGASYLASRIEAGTLQIERVITRAGVAAARGGGGGAAR